MSDLWSDPEHPKEEQGTLAPSHTPLSLWLETPLRDTGLLCPTGRCSSPLAEDLMTDTSGEIVLHDVFLEVLVARQQGCRLPSRLRGLCRDPAHPEL